MSAHINESQDALYKRSFSKIDSSGTDPNRYGSISHPEEAEEHFRKSKKKKSKKIPVNISTVERIAMIAAGSYLLYKALSKKEKSIGQSVAGGAMLLRGVTGYCPVYNAIGKDALKSENVTIKASMTVNKPVNEVYDFWRKLENLPLFMKHLESVEEKNNLISEWKAKGPAGISLSWKAQILMDERGKILSWHSLPEATIENAGKVIFSEIGSGRTEIDVVISYRAPLGLAGEAAAKLLNPVFQKMVRNDIENFKSYIESGVASINE